ncbi:MAG: hypothetical protein Q8Q63_01960 [Phaeovulum sp.]|uniref:hypothetical protein n=1 Tax=Phaeovulum sp. TaxID=2934796 RepID=UPI002731132E|nr:hypothetical protein [Phaeovulum sp.]MDP2063807.1 hypothetical protein [Phaeovulum sp.]MDP3860331.1 hypothetical protein [Phaeovulum sp.]
MPRRFALPLCLAGLAALPLQAAAQSRAVAPVFGQVVAFDVAAPFGPLAAFENATADSYILEFVPAGDTLEVWSQMLTLTGARGLVGAATTGAEAQALARQFGDALGRGYSAACPETLHAETFEVAAIAGARAVFGAYLGCGTVVGTDHSEAVVFLVLVGASDIYTLQWAERGPAEAVAPVAAADPWAMRAGVLAATQLCTPPAGEAAPYPSCTR